MARSPTAQVVDESATRHRERFKSVTDGFGHPVGDKVLAKIVARPSCELRGEDCIGRLDGEEFGMLVSETTCDGATKFAGGSRTSFVAPPFALAEPQTVTASFGVASVTAALTDHDDWFAAPDAALYRAKESGRFCSVRYGQLACPPTPECRHVRRGPSHWSACRR